MGQFENRYIIRDFYDNRTGWSHRIDDGWRKSKPKRQRRRGRRWIKPMKPKSQPKPVCRPPAAPKVAPVIPATKPVAPAAHVMSAPATGTSDAWSAFAKAVVL